MKKYPFFLLCCLTAVLFAMTSCEHDVVDNWSGSVLYTSDGQTSQNSQGVTGIQAQVTFERALQIALAHTGGGTVKEVELEHKRNGNIVYEVEIIGNQRKYEIYIDAMTGSIIRAKESRSSSSNLHAPSVSIITSANAARLSEIALAQVGGGTVTKMEFELKRGEYVFEVYIRGNDGRRHEVYIDPVTSRVIKKKKKR
jgi:uncharacterized membrane protein YkoI